MEIILLTGSNSRRSGGLYNSVRRMGQTLSQIPDTSVNILSFDDHYTYLDIEAYAPLQPISYKIKGPANFGFSPDLHKILKELSFNIVHTQCLWMYLSYINYNYSKVTRNPYLISPRGMLDSYALRFSPWKKKIIGKLFEYRHLQGAACIHSLGSSEYRSIRKFGLNNPIAIIPNAIDLPSSNFIAQKIPWEKTNGRKVLLFLGRLHQKKGIKQLLKAVSNSMNFRKDWKLIIAGDTEDKEYLSGLQWLVTKLKLERDVQFIGPQFHSDKDACFRLADAFILPSFSEGLPMSVLEAWSYRLPVLMTSACNLPEGFTYNAAIEISTDSNLLGEELTNFSKLQYTSLEILGANGFELVKKKYSWTQVSKEMHSVYEWVLGGGTPPSCVITD